MVRNPNAAAALVIALVLPVCASGQSVGKVRNLVAASTSSPGPSATTVASNDRKPGWLRAAVKHLDRHADKIGQKALVVRSGGSTIRTYTYEDLVRSAPPREPRHAMGARLARATDASAISGEGEISLAGTGSRVTTVAATDMEGSRIRVTLREKPRDDADLHVRVTGGYNEIGLLLTKKMP